MQITMGDNRLELVQGDITDQAVDAIVNAANSHLAGGGGVDGAIHRRGGPSIMDETDRRYQAGCPTGSAVISGAGNLNAKYVLHAVGPVWSGGDRDEESLLASAYGACLQLAHDHDCRSVAFPSLSTGVYRFPMDKASRIALTTAIEFLKTHDTPQIVRFVLFDRSAYDTFAAALTDCRL